MPRSSHAATRARSVARRQLMQALYQWDLSGTGLHEIRGQFLESEDFSRIDKDYFVLLFNQVSKDVAEVDNNFGEFLDRPVGQLDPVERAILRIATWELLYQPDLPYRVVINEALELTRRYCDEDAVGFVNGVLDSAASKVYPQGIPAIGSAELAEEIEGPDDLDDIDDELDDFGPDKELT